MLGNHADHFMLAQMNERVTAITPNAGGQSLQVPDRERAGAAQVTVRGGYQNPGPQRSVSSGYVPGGMLPGMGEYESGSMMPGMGANPADMLPGMGEDAGSMLPGMGGLSAGQIGGFLAVAAGIWLLCKKS